MQHCARTLVAIAATLALGLAPAAHARDDALHLPIKDVLDDPAAKARLGTDVALYFHGQSTPATAQLIAEVSTSKKTNAFNKSAEEACRWTMLSALIALAESARKQGADAVVDIRSDYRHVEFASDSQYECHAGGLMAGVALVGRIAKLQK